MAESKELAPRGRGGTVGKGTRPGRSELCKVQTEPGDNKKYLEHSLKMWRWPPVDTKQPEQVEARILEYFQLCADDDMSWGELAQWQDHFSRLGRKYGLLREFAENGII